ncbi:MAG: DUF393 domain-containing protein [Planctomycetaceae bacterium]|nr:DUF393 domain-containing protein [Planctomycetaceae bacterium]
MPNSGPNNPADLSIVFFDGVCGLCNHTVNVLMSLDRRGVLRFAPLQGEAAQALVPADVREQLNTFVFSDGGRLSYRSTALAGILRRIGGPWWLVGTFLWLIPRPLRDVAYRVVSRLRYRLFGRQESCRLPRPEERARFLD